MAPANEKAPQKRGPVYLISSCRVRAASSGYPERALHHALHHAGADPKRAGDLQDAHAFAPQGLYTRFNRGLDLKAARA
jgi:hypothetical protein